MQQGALFLQSHPGLDVTRLNEDWEYLFDQDASRHAAGIGGARTERMARLALATARPGQDTVWYQKDFEYKAGSSGRVFLRFEGAMQEARVWLNGTLLGEHYGYFAPFAFDVTAVLREKNRLVVVVRSEVEDFYYNDAAFYTLHKKHPMGIFNDWDCKPLPSCLHHLDIAFREDQVKLQPVGLWGEVTLERTGELAVTGVYVTPSLDLEQGRASVNVRVDVDGGADDARVELEISPHNFDAGSRSSLVARKTLAPKRNTAGARTAEFDLEIPDPHLWWVHTHGRPDLYTAAVKVNVGERESSRSEVRFGLRKFEMDYRPDTDACTFRLNGRRVFLKGSNYISDFYFDRPDSEFLRRDLEFFKNAHLELLRVHAHIEKSLLYELCDEAGVLVQCEFPLTFCYLYRQDEKEWEILNGRVRGMIVEMAAMFHNNPSVALYEIHNEAPWVPECAWFIGPHSSKNSKATDDMAYDLLVGLDPSRPVIKADGDLDKHRYRGWYQDDWKDYRLDSPGYVSEFGTQSLPVRQSPFWQTVRTDWPVPSQDPSWVYVGYQPVQWKTHGIGHPENYASLEEYIEKSQELQAFHVAIAFEWYRRNKFAPTGALLNFSFADGYPVIAWSVLDYYRIAKLGYAALAQAAAPLKICCDILPGFLHDNSPKIRYPQDSTIAVDYYLVNDTPAQSGAAQFRAVLCDGERELTSVACDLTVPDCEEPALKLGELRFAPAGLTGRTLTLRAAIRQDGRLLDENLKTFHVV